MGRLFINIDQRNPDWFPLVLLFLLAVGFFFPVLFMGRAPAINSLRMVEPWRTERINQGDGTMEVLPSGVPEYKWASPEGFADDLNRQFIPWGLYSQERLRSGEWPLWNPHLASGQPLFANHQTGLTNPIILLCYSIFTGISAFTAIFFIVFVLVGWGMYAYLRVLGLGRWPAFLAAVTYQFMLGYIPTLDTLVIEKALFPFLLFTIEHLVRSRSGKGAIWAILATIILALIQTSCHTQEAVFITYLVGPYLVLIAGDRNSYQPGKILRTIGKRILVAVGIYIPALLIGLFQNLPTYEFYQLSSRSLGFEEQIIETTKLEENLTWVQSLMIAFPRLFGDYLKDKLPLEHYLLNYGYVGIITLLAAPFAGWIGPNRRQVWFWRIVALIFFLAVIWNWWYFEVLCNLPLFRISLQKPFSPLFFSLIVLAGHGFAFFLDPKPIGTPANQWFGRTTLLIYATALSLGGLLIYSVILPDQPFNSEVTYVFGQIGIGVGLAALACFITSLYWRYVTLAPDREKRDNSHRLKSLAGLALVVIILIDLWPIKAHFNPFVQADDLYFPTAATNYLVTNLAWQPGDPDGPYRFGRSWKEILPPNTGMIYGLDDFGGYDSNLVGRYYQLMQAVDETIAAGVHYIETPRGRTSFESDVWNMLGVRYVAAHPGHLNQFEPVDRWRHGYNSEILILENIDALPRMHLVDRVIFLSDRDDALFRSVEIDPAVEAVVERDPESRLPIELNQVENPDENPVGSVVITNYEPEEVTARVTSNRPALLCFFDTWYPGWEVTVDGIKANLERVNYTFKGVFIEQGEHEVVFSYKPRLVLYGLAGTILGLILTLVIAKPLSILAGTAGKKPSEEENT